MSGFTPNRAQAAVLKQLAEDGSDNFGEKLSNFERLHEASAGNGCPCSDCN